ncbi:MAG: hypothetical protein PHE67_00690 [Campylobacterales bacterium]|nr:hypothetical protein [Campylobacterales bacterium]
MNKTKVPESVDIPFAREYITVGKGEWNPSINAIVLKDEQFKLGNQMLTNKAYFTEKTISGGNPENPQEKNKKKTVLTPDLKSALTKLRDSAFNNNNPVSAYEVLTISLRHYGKAKINPFYNDLSGLAKILFDKKVCIGYIHYGEYLESSGNYVDAYKVYKEGSEQTKCDGWYQAILGGKLSKLKKLSEKQ